MSWDGASALLSLAGGVYSKISANQQAQDLRQQGQAAASQVRREGAQLLGRQRVAMGKSGFEVGSTSYQALQLDDAHQIELAVLAKKYEYTNAAKRLQQQGTLSLAGSVGNALYFGARGSTTSTSPGSLLSGTGYGAGGYRAPYGTQTYGGGSDPFAMP
jgi:hypothetical protein